MGVGVTRIRRYFRAKPIWLLEGLIFVWKFDFGDNQPLIFALKHIDVPGEAMPRQPVSQLSDKPALPQGE
jgi:hypothetical protein